MTDVGGSFFLDAAGTVPDPIEDDQAMWLTTDGGTIVLLGCAHAGVVNTIDSAFEELQQAACHRGGNDYPEHGIAQTRLRPLREKGEA